MPAVALIECFEILLFYTNFPFFFYDDLLRYLC